MNKNELITFLRNPNDLTESDLGELEKIVENNPYFLNGRLLLAKASKELKHPETRKRVASAAVYSTDRPLFKKYLSDKLFFLSKPPEEEEIIKEATKPKEAKKPENKSQKIEIIESPKKVVPEEKSKEGNTTSNRDESKQDKPKREPRFDPSATASFKRRWDVKSGSESAPKSEESKKPVEKITFSGKKIDRSNRVRKKSIREELLNEEKPKNKSANPESTPVQKTVEQKTDETKRDQIKRSSEPSKSTSPSSEKLGETKNPLKEKVKNDSPPSSKTGEIEGNLKESEIKGSTSFFDDLKKTPAQKKPVEKSSIKPKPESKSSPKQTEAGKQVSVVTRTTLKPGLNVPEVPSAGIDAILEELQRDMENLKSSRTKFTEVQQKIEEDDAVSAAVERATKRIPQSPTKSEKKSVKEETEEVQKSESSSHNKAGEEKEVKPTSKKTKEKATKEKPQTKKPSSTKKKVATKKEASSKKTTTKKTSATKTATKSKTVKTKPGKKENKEEKNDDDKNGKPKADQSSIIDKFIAETPSIKYQKKSDPIQNTDLSGESTEWNKELASEYLAEIYLHQGNKKRAIEIYKALSLKFPNKKSYFADLISKIK